MKFLKNEKTSSKKFHLREIKGPKIQLTASNFQIFEIEVRLQFVTPFFHISVKNKVFST